MKRITAFILTLVLAIFMTGCASHFKKASAQPKDTSSIIDTQQEVGEDPADSTGTTDNNIEQTNSDNTDPNQTGADSQEPAVTEDSGASIGTDKLIEDTGVYTGLADNNFAEIKLDTTGEYREFWIDEVRNSIKGLKEHDKVRITYEKGTYLVLKSIEKIK